MKIYVGSEFEIVSGRLYSTICITEGVKSYPNGAWCDFIVTCLTCWYTAIRRCRKNHNVYLYFFDGDERILFSKNDDGTAILTFTDHITSEQITCDIEVSDLISEILQTCRKILNDTYNQGVESEDIEGLDQWINKRKRYINSKNQFG